MRWRAVWLLTSAGCVADTGALLNPPARAPDAAMPASDATLADAALVPDAGEQRPPCALGPLDVGGPAHSVTMARDGDGLRVVWLDAGGLHTVPIVDGRPQRATDATLARATALHRLVVADGRALVGLTTDFGLRIHDLGHATEYAPRGAFAGLAVRNATARWFELDNHSIYAHSEQRQPAAVVDGVLPTRRFDALAVGDALWIIAEIRRVYEKRGDVLRPIYLGYDDPFLLASPPGTDAVFAIGQTAHDSGLNALWVRRIDVDGDKIVIPGADLDVRMIDFAQSFQLDAIGFVEAGQPRVAVAWRDQQRAQLAYAVVEPDGRSAPVVRTVATTAQVQQPWLAYEPSLHGLSLAWLDGDRAHVQCQLAH